MFKDTFTLILLSGIINLAIVWAIISFNFTAGIILLFVLPTIAGVLIAMHSIDKEV